MEVYLTHVLCDMAMHYMGNEKSTTRFGDTRARFAVLYVRTYHTQLPRSHKSR